LNGDKFADLERIRLEILKRKIEDGIAEFKENKGLQWTSVRLENPLLETLLNLIEKEI
jgi:hypothetical protein